MSERKIIQVEDKVPFKLLLPLSIQHMFAMFGASVLVPFIFGINPAIVLFMNGVGTLIFMTVTKGKAPAYLGSSFAFLAPAGIVISKMGYSYALGGFVAVGFCGCILSFIIYKCGSYGTGRCFDRTGVIRLCSKQCGTSLRQAGYEKCNCIFSNTWCCDIWKYFIPWLFICNPNPDRSYCRICGSVLSWNLRFLTGSSSFLVRPAKLPTCKV